MRPQVQLQPIWLQISTIPFFRNESEAEGGLRSRRWYRLVYRSSHWEVSSYGFINLFYASVWHLHGLTVHFCLVNLTSAKDCISVSQAMSTMRATTIIGIVLLTRVRTVYCWKLWYLKSCYFQSGMCWNFDALFFLPPWLIRLSMVAPHITTWQICFTYRPVYGGVVGPTFACLLGLEFQNFKYGDRFWFQNELLPHAFTPYQINKLKKVSEICATLS